MRSKYIDTHGRVTYNVNTRLAEQVYLIAKERGMNFSKLLTAAILEQTSEGE